MFAMALIIGGASYMFMKTYLENSNREKLVNRADHETSVIQKTFNDMKVLMNRLSEGRQLREYKKTDNREMLAEYFAKFREEFPVLSYVNEQGIEEVKVVNGELSEYLLDMKDSITFQDALWDSNTVMIEPHVYSADLDKFVMRLVMGKYGYFGDELIGIIKAEVPLTRFSENMTDDKIGMSGFMSIIDKDGSFISFPEDRWIFDKLIIEGPGSSELLADISSLKKGFMRVMLLGLDAYAAYTPVQETGWTLMAILPYEEFIAAPNRLRNVSIIIFLTLIFVGGLVASGLARGITRPLSGLVAATEKIAKGDLAVTIPVTTADELGTLAASFNKMAEDLKKSQDRLIAFAERKRIKAKELKITNKKLRETQSLLIQSEKMSALGELGAGIAHELNSPLAGVLTLIRLYMKDKAPESEEFEDLKEMREACEHMAQIIKNFSLFSAPNTGEQSDLDLNELIETTLSFSGKHKEKQGLKIEQNYSSDLSLFQGNKNQVQQVILNMVMNASQAMSGKGVLKITTRMSEKNGSGEYVEMEFTDNGCGITKEDMKRIFDPFFTTKRPGKGVGLGLSITHTLVENHNGKIRVESEQGKGTTFTVMFPLSNNVVKQEESCLT